MATSVNPSILATHTTNLHTVDPLNTNPHTTDPLNTKPHAIDPLNVNPHTIDPLKSKTLGLICVDIVKATDLPHVSKRAGSYFVIASFGRNIFRTHVSTRGVNGPEWSDRIFFLLTEQERQWPIQFSIYSHNVMSEHAVVGRASIDTDNLLSGFTQGVYTSDSHKATQLTPHLDMVDSTIPIKAPGESSVDPSSRLWLNVAFVPLPVLRAKYKLLTDKNPAPETAAAPVTTSTSVVGPSSIGQTHNPLAGNYTSLDNGATIWSPSNSAKEEVATVTNCPSCNTTFDADADSTDVMAHVVACASSTEGKPVRLINPMFVTEEQASRKWISRAMHRLVYGKYKIGSNDGNVTVVDRRTGTPFEEDIATHDHLRLRLLYESPLVRTMEWTNVRRYFRSKTLGYGMTYNDPKSAAHIPAFIRVYGVNVNEAERLPKEYSTMNEFFGRKLKPGVRPIEKPNDPTVAVSATDSRTMVFESIDQVTRLWIKGKKFSIGRLLDDETESARYVDGSLIIWRLAPHDYHRFHLPVDGVLSQPKNVPGEYYAVSPIGSRSPLDVLGENKRTVSYIESPHFGRVAYVCIGATEVASIVLTSQPGVSLHKGTEHGYFQYGGSTVVAVFEKGKIKFDADLITNSKEPVETYIQMGTSIGTSISTTIGTSFGIPVSSIIS